MVYLQKRRNYTSIIIFIILLIFIIFSLLPFLFMLTSSFKPGVEIMRKGISINLDFKLWSLNNYKLLMAKGQMYLHWYKNSLIITIFYTTFSVFFCAMVGYSLAVYNFKGKNLIFTIIIITMTVPVEILLLSLYRLSVTFNMVNTYWGVILPFLVNPTAIFFFRQYALGLPKELMEAARLDGCTEYGIYFRIMMPLMKPAFGAMVILRGLWSWNSFIWPLIILRTENMITLPVGLSSLITPYGNNYDVLLAGSVMGTLPLIILFLFNQKAFISGLKAGAIKG